MATPAMPTAVAAEGRRRGDGAAGDPRDPSAPSGAAGASGMGCVSIAGSGGRCSLGGGDGTVSEVARELVHKPATLGILPIGTFNNIARSIGVPADLPVAANIIATGHESKINVGLANDTHYFIEAAGAGLDAKLFPVGEEIKGGRWTRIVQAARLAFQYQPQPNPALRAASLGWHRWSPFRAFI